MKLIIFFSTVLFCLLVLAACQRKIATQAPALPTDFFTLLQNAGSRYDSTFARKPGADEHGMKKYVMAYLKRGPNRSQDAATAAQLQKTHLDNIDWLAAAGKLVLAGPFLDDGEVRGIYIFDVTSLEEARQLTESDPAIQAGRLIVELHPWYGSAVLPLITPLHQRLGKNQRG